MIFPGWFELRFLFPEIDGETIQTKIPTQMGVTSDFLLVG